MYARNRWGICKLLTTFSNLTKKNAAENFALLPPKKFVFVLPSFPETGDYMSDYCFLALILEDFQSKRENMFYYPQQQGY